MDVVTGFNYVARALMWFSIGFFIGTRNERQNWVDSAKSGAANVIKGVRYYVNFYTTVYKIEQDK